MKKLQYLALILIAALALCSCAQGVTNTASGARQLNQWATDLTEAKRLVYADNWFRLSGLLHGYFGAELAGLPVETAKTIAEIDQLMTKQILTDYDIWYICGSAMRASTPVINEWSNKAMPYLGRDIVSLLRFVGWL